MIASLKTVLGHGHRFSSQFIHRHDSPAHPVHVSGYDRGQGHGHDVGYYVSDMYKKMHFQKKKTINDVEASQ